MSIKFIYIIWPQLKLTLYHLTWHIMKANTSSDPFLLTEGAKQHQTRFNSACLPIWDKTDPIGITSWPSHSYQLMEMYLVSLNRTRINLYHNIIAQFIKVIKWSHCHCTNNKKKKSVKKLSKNNNITITHLCFICWMVWKRCVVCAALWRSGTPRVWRSWLAVMAGLSLACTALWLSGGKNANKHSLWLGVLGLRIIQQKYFDYAWLWCMTDIKIISVIIWYVFVYIYVYHLFYIYI